MDRDFSHGRICRVLSGYCSHGTCENNEFGLRSFGDTKGTLLRGASALGMGMVFCFMLNHCFRINDARICEVVFLDGIIKGLE